MKLKQFIEPGKVDMEILMSNLPTIDVATIAVVIATCWSPMYFGAVPYVQAMREMETVDSSYGYDNGRSIILYFLANAATWRGPIAKAVKAELNKRLKAKG